MTLALPDFAGARVLVAGDVMLDRYWHGPTSRISPEAPVPVIKVEGREDRPGGAANVALNLAALGAGAALIGVVGRDEAGHVLEALLQAAGVETTLPGAEGVSTILKLRVVSRGQQLLRLDFEDPLDHAVPEGFGAQFSALLEGCGAVVLSDYAKGTLRDAPDLIARARAAGRPVLVDPKTADVTVYRGATLMTPNMSEFEAMVGPCGDDETMVARGLRLVADLDQEALLVTRGDRGMTLIVPGQPALHLPSHAREVYDVTGAGDTVVSVLAACLAAGASLEAGARLANLAAGLVVSKQGTAAVSAAELRRAAARTDEVARGAVSEEQLVAATAVARARGERLVMTNGCFDILHAGHVSYLHKARALGDRLVVAVNDDASTRGLKGPGRPVNTLGRRMAVLAALECVDWVVPFGEPTPERLICRVLPDVLVKGADYRPEEIAGADCVLANGGTVQVVDLVEGVSTTAILRAGARPPGQP